MTTIACPPLRLPNMLVILRQSWPVAIVEAIVFAIAALGVGPAGVDPDVGFRR